MRCEKCKYRFEALLGVGMMHDGVFDVLHLSSQERLKKLRIFIQDRAIAKQTLILLEEGATADDYENELYACPQCHRLYTRLYFRLHTEAKTYEPDYKCPHCSTLLKRTILGLDADEPVIAQGVFCSVVYRDEPTVSVSCPKCGNNTWRYDTGILWD